MKRLLIASVLVLPFGCGQAPKQEKPPAGFKQVIIIDESGAHTVTMPAANVPSEVPGPRLPVQPAQPVLPAPKPETVIGQDGFR